MSAKIPKIIHYCWFGGNPKPEMVNRCINSWKKYLPDYKIVEWNESNYDISSTKYMRDAYELKKWAFVSDYARFDILYKFGGIYLDVDVEFIHPLPESFLELEGLCGFECSGEIAPGLIFGIRAHNPLLKIILETYANESFRYEKNGIYKTVNKRLTDILVDKGLKKNNSIQVIDGIKVFPDDYFCGYDTDVREPKITENTICWHHYYGSWANPSLKIKAQNILKKIIGVNNYRKVLNLKRVITKNLLYNSNIANSTRD